METIVLGTPEAEISIGALAARLGPAGAEVRDAKGRVVAYFLPQTQGELKWPESFPRELVLGGDPRTRSKGCRGITTQQMLEKLQAIPLPPNAS